MIRRPPLSRRALLSGIGALGLGTGAVVAAGDDRSDGSDWPMYRHDPAGTAHAPEASVPREKPTERWSHEFDNMGFRTPGPILYDGQVFVARESLTAFDAASGDSLFRIASDDDGSQFLSTPAVASARAYVTPSLVTASEYGFQAIGVDGGPDLPVIDGSGLARRWSTDEQPDSQLLASLGFGDGRQSPPVAAGGTVFAPDDGIVAVDASSGSVRWRTPVESFASRPAVADGSLYTVSYDGTITEYAVDGGTQRWTASTPAVRQELQPTVANGSLYLAHEAGVTALDPDGGDERWTSGEPDGEYGRYVTPATVTQDAVYAAGSALLGDEDDGLVALDAESGERLWDAPLQSMSEGDDGPAVADGVVLQPDHYTLRAFDAATGEELWRIDRETQVSQPAIGRDGRFYLADGLSIAAYGGA
ncbi:hypothetical protein BV210_00810 [Halorientalis sp. IM1011]|uniref:PQQ-binding-like beta-propeller repeat protein n=1 Tax=Halorientalis sp. IM1011 TaxID=1932360 RepID=UPI00097CC30C|nr:PQQ-binding-like beta-propeller repeat protein [Halorientalis sp. IM1011]AQL41342.1 hypothetical protein BV210_00810 [Halorientalis sp. IM1011]